ncbi:MAG: UDP-N-acetylmuramate--L-alanine ligase [Clostridia bacterium]|nr:UDP-N-acetylmuramate--L-alanine ligase [Clostridia bacterium]
MALSNSGLDAAAVAAALSGKKRLWFIGIGGVHMASLARLARARGFAVAGSDRVGGARVEGLRREGITVFVGHDAAHMVDFDAVIYTLALSPDNPEYCAARNLGLPAISRADFLGYLMEGAPRRIGVAGSHGKSTVTAMLGAIFTAAGRDPTVVCGAEMDADGSALLLGNGPDFIFEACEYKDSFLSFTPTLALVLNVQHDHADYFPTPQSLYRSFAAFAALPGAGGTVLYNADDPVACEIAAKSPATAVSFGIERGDCHAAELCLSGGFAQFIPVYHGIRGSAITLRIPGRHNVANALAAYAAARLSGVDAVSASSALSGFSGAARRMEYRGLLHGARVFDDYAHHPTEIAAALTTAREMLGNGGRLFAVFQSHTYTRTAHFWNEICAALRLADRVLITNIYAAREAPIEGVTAAALAADVGAQASYVGGLSAIADTLTHELAAGDLLLVMGAGDIDLLFREFSGKHFTIE